MLLVERHMKDFFIYEGQAKKWPICKSGAVVGQKVMRSNPKTARLEIRFVFMYPSG